MSLFQVNKKQKFNRLFIVLNIATLYAVTSLNILLQQQDYGGEFTLEEKRFHDINFCVPNSMKAEKTRKGRKRLKLHQREPQRQQSTCNWSQRGPLAIFSELSRWPTTTTSPTRISEFPLSSNPPRVAQVREGGYPLGNI